ncbi:MAG TPA: hypothetical protein VGV88_02560 [Candidatus Dormibacteraeota bacterium]|nr:hypothetical protein [Candidatus Dormibacteraeota bacterium]
MVIAFVVVAGYLIYKNQGGGGKNVTFDVTVTHADTMKPSELDVHQNDMVTINITSDMDGEVHLHGYDIHFDNIAGNVTTHSFKADKSGTFEIEWESSSTHLGNLVVAP